MNKTFVFRKHYLLASIFAFVGQSQADVLLSVDLTVENQITITATNGLSASTVSGNVLIGAYLDNFYNAPGVDLGGMLVASDFSNAENPTDNSANLFRGGFGMDPGLNLWAWSDDINVSFTANAQAFVGSATWNLLPTEYADMLAGNTSGNIYFPADTVDDIASAAFLGTYNVIVPTPGTITLLALSIGCQMRRRRRVP